jgi:hypothetical protein
VALKVKNQREQPNSCTIFGKKHAPNVLILGIPYLPSTLLYISKSSIFKVNTLILSFIKVKTQPFWYIRNFIGLAFPKAPDSCYV